MAYCIRCSKLINEYDSGYYARAMLCITCYEDKMIERQKVQCMRCMRFFFPQEIKPLGGHDYCAECNRMLMAEIEKRRCHACKRVLEEWEDRVKAPDGWIVCKKCHDSMAGKFGAKQCAMCGRMAKVKMVVGDRFICMDCFPTIEKKKSGVAKLIGMAELVRGMGKNKAD